MNDTTNPARRLRHGDRPTDPLRWNDRWTLLLTGPTMGLIGPYGSTWPNQSAEYERVNVIAENSDQAAEADAETIAWMRPDEIQGLKAAAGKQSEEHFYGKVYARKYSDDMVPVCRVPRILAPKLESIEQYRMQMAAIGTASFGYWKEGDTIHPDYDTVPLRDVARLYAKYEKLHAFHSGVRTMIEMLKNREWAEDLGAHGDLAELQGLITELVGKVTAASQWISTAPHGDNCFVSDHHEGDPGNRCNCGKDSLQEYLESDSIEAEPPFTLREIISAMILEHDAGGITMATMRDARAAVTAPDTVDAAEKLATLTAEEQAFVELVRQRPGHKLNSGEARGADGSDLWKRPQDLGLILAVGSYKWVVPGAQAQQPVADAVEAAMVDAVVHGTGAFRVHGDGSTEHVDLHAQNRAAAEIVAFSPPAMVRDALYQDYAVPKPTTNEGGKGE